MDGWVKLHRKLIDSQVFGDDKALRVWIWCLCKANFKAKFWKGQDVPAGAFICGRKSGAQETQLTESSFYRALQKLETWGMIELSSKSKWTTVKVLNYMAYQTEQTQTPLLGHRTAEGVENVNRTWTGLSAEMATTYGNGELQSEQHLNNRRTTDEQQMNTTKECKEQEDCEKQKGGRFFFGHEFTNSQKKAIQDWVQYLDSKSIDINRIQLKAIADVIASLGESAEASVTHSIAGGYKAIIPAPTAGKKSAPNERARKNRDFLERKSKENGVQA